MANNCGNNKVYFPPKKLREGHVFSRVCLSMGGGSHDALVLTIEGPPGPYY